MLRTSILTISVNIREKGDEGQGYGYLVQTDIHNGLSSDSHHDTEGDADVQPGFLQRYSYYQTAQEQHRGVLKTYTVMSVTHTITFLLFYNSLSISLHKRTRVQFKFK